MVYPAVCKAVWHWGGGLAGLLGQSANFYEVLSLFIWQNQANWIHCISTASGSLTECKNHSSSGTSGATMFVTYICDRLSLWVRMSHWNLLAHHFHSYKLCPICSVLFPSICLCQSEFQSSLESSTWSNVSRNNYKHYKNLLKYFSFYLFIPRSKLVSCFKYSQEAKNFQKYIQCH